MDGRSKGSVVAVFKRVSGSVFLCAGFSVWGSLSPPPPKIYTIAYVHTYMEK